MSTPSRGRTIAQNNRIYGLRAALERAGLEAEDVAGIVREICLEVSGQEHTSRLSETQATRVIVGLEERVKRSETVPRPAQAAPAPHKPWGPRGGEDRTAQPVTARQLEVISSLCQDAGLTTLPQRVGFFARQLQGRRRVETQADADAIIEPLKAMILRKVSANDVSARLEAVRTHPKLAQDRFLPGFVADVSARVEKQGKKAAGAGA
jgi:hypothetical protein